MVILLCSRPAAARVLGGQLHFRPRPQLCQVLALRLTAVALLGREELLVCLLQELLDALLHATVVLPATRLLAPTTIVLAPAPKHDGGEDELAHRQEAEHPGDDGDLVMYRITSFQRCRHHTLLSA
jgi:hypothetical protein